MKKILSLSLTVLLFAAVCLADDREKDIERLQSAAQVLDEVMAAPDRGVPQQIMDSAECVAVVPSMFIERVSASPGRIFPAGRVTFTDREKEVLELLVVGRSNKEIGAALGIEERTVKAHVAKLMRKVGVQNRIALSVHAITHSLVTANK